MSYTDIYYEKSENPVFCYRSALCVYEETMQSGVLISSGYNAGGYVLNTLKNCPSRLDRYAFSEPSAFNIELDGQSIDHGLEFVDFCENRTDDGSIKAVLTLDSTLKPVRLKIHTLIDGTHMFSRYIEIENLSDRPMNLSRLCVLSGGLESMKKAELTNCRDIRKYYSLGYFDRDGWGREGEFSWQDLNPCMTSVDFRFGRDRFRHPLLFLRNNVTGTFFFSQIEWTAGCRYSVDYRTDSENNNTSVSLKAEIISHKPLTVIEGGETFVTPTVHMGVVSGDLDDAVNEMHAHIRKSVLCEKEADPTACLVGAGMGAEHDMSVQTTKEYIDQMAEMGAEVFIIDAGWVCPPDKEMQWGDYNGINVQNDDRYPNGLKELSDYCREKGMRFALWVDIEKLGKFSPVYKEHPEWRAENIFGEKSHSLLDLSKPDAAAWAEEELARIIEEYNVELLRVDHNISYREYFTVRDGECLSVKHFNAIHRIYDNLHKRFPKVIFENCAGGGGRTDLAMMKSFNHTWVSDWQKVPHSVMITNGMTMALPPERVDRLFAGMGCHTVGSLHAHMRNVMLTHMSLNVIAPTDVRINSDQMNFVRHSVNVYKNFIRPFLPTSKIYHHTPDVAKSLDDGFCSLEVASDDRTKAAVALFTLTMPKDNRFTVIPKGINSSYDYKVTFDNSGDIITLSGYEIITKGITALIPSALHSELVLIEAIK
ncbi:MAG: alpha-galactosidase [Clostridia bacterium]|nr:alpha-galactosidase [Clostridia bacterium]